MKQKQARQIPGIDLLRAVAALMVVFFHLAYWYWTPGDGWRGPMPHAFAALRPVASVGWVGVEIFFVISGFVIAYSIEDTTPGRFAKHRIARLLPAAMICASLTAAFLLRGHAQTFQAVFLLWLRAVVLSPWGPWIDGSYWTLPIELAFYVLIFSVLLVGQGRRVPAVVAILGLTSTAVSFLRLNRTNPLFENLDFPPKGCLLLVHGCLFALGVYLFLTLMHGATRFRLMILAVCGLGSMLEIFEHWRILATASLRMNGPLLPIALWVSAIGFLGCSVVMNERMQRWAGVHGAAAIRNIGLATYPLYLVHNLGHMIINFLRGKVGYGWGLALAVVLVITAAFTISAFLEPPLRRLLQTLLSKTTSVSKARKERGKLFYDRSTHMPTIAERINQNIITAMKAHEDMKVTTLRMAKAALKNKEIDKRQPLTEGEEQAVLQTMLKQRRDSAEQFTKGGRPELAEKERAEIGMIEDYLPKQAQEEDIRPIIQGAMAHVAKDNGGQRPGPKDMGPVMRTVQMRIATSGLFVDSKTVSDLVKRELAGGEKIDPATISDGGFYGG